MDFSKLDFSGIYSLYLYIGDYADCARMIGSVRFQWNGQKVIKLFFIIFTFFGTQWYNFAMT